MVSRKSLVTCVEILQKRLSMMVALDYGPPHLRPMFRIRGNLPSRMCEVPPDFRRPAFGLLLGGDESDIWP